MTFATIRAQCKKISKNYCRRYTNPLYEIITNLIIVNLITVGKKIIFFTINYYSSFFMFTTIVFLNYEKY